MSNPIPRFARATAALILVAGLAGCASPVAILIDPRAPVSAHSDTVIVTDSRADAGVVPTRHGGQVEAKQYVGQSLGFIFALHTGSVSELVGSVVAVQIPNAHVDVSEFAVDVDYGLWLATANCKITATIAPVGKAAFVVRASGSNNYVNPTPENFELAVDSALTDFADKLKAAP